MMAPSRGIGSLERAIYGASSHRCLRIFDCRTLSKQHRVLTREYDVGSHPKSVQHLLIEP